MTKHTKLMAVKGGQFMGYYIPTCLCDYYSVWRVTYVKRYNEAWDIKKVVAVSWNCYLKEVNPKFFKNLEEAQNGY